MKKQQKRAKPQPLTPDQIKDAYKLYLSKEFTLAQITRVTKVSAYWIYKHHNQNLKKADSLQLKLI